jgi:rhomboid protease GluP
MSEPVYQPSNEGAQTAGTETFKIAYESFLQATRNALQLRGKGTAQVKGGVLLLAGKRRRPFWFSKQMEIGIPLEQIFDVRADGRKVEFRIEPAADARRRTPMPMALFLDEAGAQALAAALPARMSADGAERAAYEAKLGTGRTPATVALLAANIAAYVAFAAMGHGFLAADPKALIDWGSNFGPYTSGGQWWRLASAAFLHGSLVHLAVNMLALYDVGRLCERLYGTRRYLVLYALSGLLGSAASLWWNPMVNSVGASGALFGVLGATFVFMLDKRNGVPVGIMSAHATSMGVFILYGLYNGFSKAGIDNAAHLGGLAAGMALGFALAAPFGAGARPPAARAGAGVAVCVAAILALALLTPNTRQAWDTEVNFTDVLKRVIEEEKSLIDRTRETLAGVQKASVTQAEAGRALAGIAGQWSDLRGRLAAYPLAQDSRFAQTRQDLVEYASLRQRALARLARAFSSPEDDSAGVAEFTQLMKQGDAVTARMMARTKNEKTK